MFTSVYLLTLSVLVWRRCQATTKVTLLQSLLVNVVHNSFFFLYASLPLCFELHYLGIKKAVMY